MREKYITIADNVEQELTLWENLKILYDEKTDVLIHKNADSLNKVDAKVLDTLKKIYVLTANRKQIAYSIGINELKLTDLIKNTKSMDKLLSEKFANLQVRLKKISKEITFLENKNNALLKHGINLNNKTMQIIFDVMNIYTDSYDKKGQNNITKDIGLSSVVEEV